MLFRSLREEANEIIKTLEEENIGTITVGIDFETSKEAVLLSERSTNLFAGIGLHPTNNNKEKFDPETYKKLAQNPKVVCIGECGLDYYRIPQKNIETEAQTVVGKQRNRQKEIFKKQIELALELDLPLMLHIRPTQGTQDAYEDALEILSTSNTKALDRKSVV